MKVRDLMATNVACCGPRTNAASIADILWSKDCGSIPVVDERNTVLGIVTDRDLFIALGTRNKKASEVTADDVMTRDVATCGPDDDVKQALALMQSRRVRRIPVVDRDWTLRGMLSIYDLAKQAATGSNGVSQGSVLNAMTRIAERSALRLPAPAGAAS